MYASDFVFDGQRASDFGLIVGYINNEASEATGGSITYNTAKTYGRDTYSFFGASLEDPLVWEIGVTKNPCDNASQEDMYFTQYEESAIAKWLLRRDNYHWLQFDQDGFEDIYYKVTMQMAPEQIGGRTIGYKITATANTGYGFSKEYKKEFVIKDTKKFTLNINSDIKDVYIYPTVIINTASNRVHINNYSDIYEDPILKNISNREIIMNSELDIIDGILSPDDFEGFRFLRFVDGENVLQVSASDDVYLTIKYREPRRVIV